MNKVFHDVASGGKDLVDAEKITLYLRKEKNANHEGGHQQQFLLTQNTKHKKELMIPLDDGGDPIFSQVVSSKETIIVNK